MTIQGPQWTPDSFPIGPGTNPVPNQTFPYIPSFPPPLPTLPPPVTNVIKCPDCGTWWRGYEHRCPSSSGWTSTTNTFIFNDNGEAVPQTNGGKSLKDEMDAARKKAKGGKSRKRLDTDPPDMIR